MIRRTPLRRISKKKTRELAEYTRLRAVFMQQKPTCEVCHTKKSVDVHHKAGRLSGNYLNETTWLAACRSCHDWVHSHPSLARKHGLLA